MDSINEVLEAVKACLLYTSMFLLESSTIGFIGGLIGLGISLIASFVLNNLSTLGQGLDPVSYTHLDVYKRQSP